MTRGRKARFTQEFPASMAVHNQARRRWWDGFTQDPDRGPGRNVTRAGSPSLLPHQRVQPPQHPPQFLHLLDPPSMSHLARLHALQPLGCARPCAGVPVHSAAKAPTHRRLPAWSAGPHLCAAVRRGCAITSGGSVLLLAATQGVVSHLCGHFRPTLDQPGLASAPTIACPPAFTYACSIRTARLPMPPRRSSASAMSARVRVRFRTCGSFGVHSPPPHCKTQMPRRRLAFCNATSPIPPSRTRAPGHQGIIVPIKQRSRPLARCLLLRRG